MIDREIVPPSADSFPEWLRPACPHLPEALPGMSFRDLSRYRNDRGGPLYLTALRYGNVLWRKGFSARAILALDRALFSDVIGGEPEVVAWPMPYRALRWMLREHSAGDGFLGNPRISYQHLAGRVRGDRREQRVWRAWACWYLTRQLLPELPRDTNHRISEPGQAAIAQGLREHGIPGEDVIWRAVAAEGPVVEPEM